MLQNLSDGLGFYKVADGSTVEAMPFRAYLTAQSGSSRLGIVYEGGTTGISSVDAEDAQSESYFTLSGVRVSQPAKGIYVKNGKKIIVK